MRITKFKHVERLKIEVENLGIIVVYRDKGGFSCDINGKRAWSAWNDSLRGIELTLRAQIHSWKYLNSFKDLSSAPDKFFCDTPDPYVP